LAKLWTEARPGRQKTPDRDPDPGCPFLGPGSRMPVPWRRANWYLVPGQGGQRDLPATLGQISPDT